MISIFDWIVLRLKSPLKWFGLVKPEDPNREEELKRYKEEIKERVKEAS